jgi:gliding motility-associated-like protein
MKRHLLAILLILSGLCCFPQCYQKHYFTYWRQQGSTSAEWTLINDSTAYQSNEPNPATPTFFVSNISFINVVIDLDVMVETYFDNDFIGVVLDYQRPNASTSDYDCDFVLFDWKRDEENFNSNFAEEGFTLSRVDGIIDENHDFFYYWRHNGYHNDPVMQNLGVNHGNGKGWLPGKTYHLQIRYTTSRIIILVDDEEIFNVKGCFKPGKVGFFTFSQRHVVFSNFSYRLASEFFLADENICIGASAEAYLVDPACPSNPANIDHWVWDFGDGYTTSEMNPVHEYLTPGSYPIQLIAYDAQGCTDTVTHDIRVHPLPELWLGNDTLIPYEGSISLEAGAAPNASYFWTTGESSSTIELNNLTDDTLVGVTKTMNGCSVADEILIMVGEKPVVPEFRYFMPNAFTPNGDARNDVFKPIFTNATIDFFEMVIFDRWGKRITSVRDPLTGWDGKCSGTPCPPGIYTYVMRYEVTDESSQPFQKAIKGVVCLVR